MSVVYALATPPAKSAICVFRVTGGGCLKFLKEIFGDRSFESNKFYVVPFNGGGLVIDQVGLVVFKSPKSYTGEDSFEVYAHGSLGVMSGISKTFSSLGFDEAPGGEFTKRAFLNNKISLNEAEAVSDLIESTDEKGVVLSTKALFGGLSSEVSLFAEELDLIRVRVEAEIDFSDEGEDFFDLKGLVDDLRNLANRFDLFVGGCVNKRVGFQKNNIVLVGPVNSGKSSVFNRLVGFERAIVSDVPGTTRDMIDSELFYESSVFSVFDTAGIRNTDDGVEKLGIERSVSQINDSDLVVGVFEVVDEVVINYFKGLCDKNNFILVQNKIDINKPLEDFFDCCVSAKTGDGFDRLKGLVVDCFNSGIKKDKYDYLVRDRHEALFRQVILDLNTSIEGLLDNKPLELVAEDLKNARSNLDEVVGIKFSDSLLGDIFSSFCIGK